MENNNIIPKGKVAKKPCVVIVTNDENEKFALIKSGSGGTPSFPQSTMDDLRNALHGMEGQGYKYKSTKLGKVYYGPIDSTKIYYQAVLVEIPGHTEEFLDMLIGKRKIYWLGPGDISKLNRRIGCALTIAGLARFADYFSVLLDRSPDISYEKASRDESLRWLAKRLREGSDIMNSGKSCSAKKASKK